MKKANNTTKILILISLLSIVKARTTNNDSSCPTGCETCLGGSCTKCADGYRLQNGDCSRCNEVGCKDCSGSTGFCQTCMTGSGYFQTGDSPTSGKTCEACTKYCATCDNTETCETCAILFELTDDKKCKASAKLYLILILAVAIPCLIITGCIVACCCCCKNSSKSRYRGGSRGSQHNYGGYKPNQTMHNNNGMNNGMNNGVYQPPVGQAPMGGGAFPMNSGPQMGGQFRPMGQPMNGPMNGGFRPINQGATPQPMGMYNHQNKGF